MPIPSTHFSLFFSPTVEADGGQILTIGAPLLATLRQQLKDATAVSDVNASSIQGRYAISPLPSIKTPDKKIDYVLLGSTTPGHSTTMLAHAPSSFGRDVPVR